MRRSIAVLATLLLASCTHSRRATLDDARFDAPDEAARYFAMKRGVTPGFDLTARYAAARAQMERMSRTGSRVVAEAATTRLPGTWQFLGPGNVGGRTRALLIDPHNPNVMFAGASSGGVWRTTDGGGAWATVTDFLPNIAVNSLAFDPADSRVIYAGTGEGYFREEIRGTALPLRGNGIFVSRDGGDSWSQLASTAGEDFYFVNDLAVSSHDSRRLYAATRRGVFRSLDSGETWTRVLATTVTGGCLDLAFRGDTEHDYLFASCGTLDQGTVYRSTDAEHDAPWASVLSDPGMGRTTLAIAPSNPSIVYALAAQNGGTLDMGLHALYRSSASGDAGSWVVQTRPGASDTFGPLLLTNVFSVTVPNNCTDINMNGASQMGWHCNVVAVDPRDPNRVWAAGVDLFRSDDGGRTWGEASYWWTSEQASAFVHADQHVIVFDPRYDGASNQTMLVTNDGGVYRTDNARADVASTLRDACIPSRSKVAFRSLNRDFGATQFYHGAVWPDGDSYLGGAQDNGSVIGFGADPNAWRAATGGDGGFVAIDPADPLIVYTEAQNARVFRSIDGGGRFFQVANPREDEFIFVSPLLVDPNAERHDIVWIGGGLRLWRSRFDADGEVPSSAKLDSGNVSALAMAAGGSSRMIFGTTTGAIYRGDTLSLPDANTRWASTKPRDGWVSSVTFDPSTSEVVYATYAGFGGGAHVWRSADSGATWTPIDGSGDGALPDIPAHAIVVQGQTLYLGTDLGIFVSADGGASWASDSGFPHAITEALAFANGPRGPELFAFTHGRGAWRLTVPPQPRRRAIGR